VQKLAFPYKNQNNQRYSKQLFLEKWRELPIELRVVAPPFTLNLEREGYVCLRQEYVNDGDPTGYTTSLRIFGEFAYWQYLCGIRWFVEAKEEWDKELEAKLRSEGIAKIRKLAEGDDPKALGAARFLATLEYKKGGTTLKRGRPSKEEIEGNIKEEIRQRDAVDEDAERIKLICKN